MRSTRIIEYSNQFFLWKNCEILIVYRWFLNGLLRFKASVVWLGTDYSKRAQKTYNLYTMMNEIKRTGINVDVFFDGCVDGGCVSVCVDRCWKNKEIRMPRAVIWNIEWIKLFFIRMDVCIVLTNTTHQRSY